METQKSFSLAFGDTNNPLTFSIDGIGSTVSATRHLERFLREKLTLVPPSLNFVTLKHLPRIINSKFPIDSSVSIVPLLFP